jgi:hypothetical protein
VRWFASDGVNVREVCGYSAEEDDDDEPDNTTTTTTTTNNNNNNNNNNNRTCNLTGDQMLASQRGTSSSKPGGSIVRFVVHEVACQHVPPPPPEFLRFSPVSHHSTIARNLSTALPSQQQIPAALGSTQSNSRRLSAVTNCLREVQHEHQVHMVPLTASATR